MPASFVSILLFPKMLLRKTTKSVRPIASFFAFLPLNFSNKSGRKGQQAVDIEKGQSL
jgi:hypothetical protein